MSNWKLWLTAFTNEQLPDPEYRMDFAFCGRSNAGKSTLINSLTKQKHLAKTAKAPGKTRSINFYINDKLNFNLVDLPGFGYAKVSKEENKKWSGLMESYFLKKGPVRYGFLLCDIRHGLTKIDKEAMEYLSTRCYRLDIIFTKSDKLPKNQKLNMAKKHMKGLKNNCHLISSLKNEGIEELLEFMQGISSSFISEDPESE